jgi:hypothetical protein
MSAEDYHRVVDVKAIKGTTLSAIFWIFAPALTAIADV